MKSQSKVKYSTNLESYPKPIKHEKIKIFYQKMKQMNKHTIMKETVKKVVRNNVDMTETR